MSPLPTSPAHKQLETLQLIPDLVLRVGFAGKRELVAAQSETVRNRLRDVFSVMGWRLVLSQNQKSTIGNHQPVRRSLGEVGSSTSAAARVTQLTADPDNGLGTDSPAFPISAFQFSAFQLLPLLLTEFFDHGDSPARQEKQWMTRLRKTAWTFLRNASRTAKKSHPIPSSHPIRTTANVPPP